MTNLVFVEQASQFEALHRAGIATSDCIICPLKPDAVYYCEANAIPFIRESSCYTDEEFDQAKADSIRRINVLRAALNAYSTAIGNLRIGFPLELGNYFLGLILPSLGSCHVAAFVIDRVVKTVKPTKILSFTSSVPPGNYLGLINTPAYSIYSALLRISPFHSMVTYLAEPESGPLNARRFVWRHWLKNNFFIHDIYELRKHGFSIVRTVVYFLQKLFTPSRGCKALFIGPLYNFGKLFRQADPKELSFRIFWGETFPLDPAPNQVVEPFMVGWQDRPYGIDVSALYREKIAIILRSLEMCCTVIPKYQRILANADIVLSSCLVFPQQQMLAHAAKVAGKKVVIWTHGSKGFTRSLLSDESNDLVYSDTVLTFGDGVTSYYRQTYGWYEREYVSVGSVLSETARTKDDRSGTYILYATGKYMMNITGFTEVKGPDEHLYNAQKEILKYLQSQRYLPVIYKKNPTVYLGDIPFATTGLGTIQFEKSFVSLIADARMIVLDSPTTAAIEAAASNKPVFALMTRVQYTPEALALLSKRAMISTTIADLLSKVDTYLTRGIYTADLTNREFVQKYSTHLDDGKSIERVREIVRLAIVAPRTKTPHRLR